MKIAYLVTAFNNYQHLERLINALNDDTKPSFFIHIDKKSSMPKNLNNAQNMTFIKRTKVWWGGWSHLAAILSLMKKASEENFDYYILLSGTDYPIRPNSFLYNKLKDGGEYFNLLEGFQSHKPVSRIKYYYFDQFDRRNKNSSRTKFFLFLERKLRKKFTKKKFPFLKIYHGSTWWALSHATVNYVLEFTDANPKFVKFFRTSWCPEEAYIPTLIGNSDIKNNCKTNLTYMDWSTEPAPALLSIDHIYLFRKQNEFDGVYGKYSPFFARKFRDDSHELITEIEVSLR
jgi:hypothetical protein